MYCYVILAVSMFVGSVMIGIMIGNVCPLTNLPLAMAAHSNQALMLLWFLSDKLLSLLSNVLLAASVSRHLFR